MRGDGKAAAKLPVSLPRLEDGGTAKSLPAATLAIASLERLFVTKPVDLVHPALGFCLGRALNRYFSFYGLHRLAFHSGSGELFVFFHGLTA